MSDRKEIHEQINDMIERIGLANRSLLNNKRLLAVEVELLRSYNRELGYLIDQLSSETNTATAPSPKIQEPQPEPIVEPIAEEERVQEEQVVAPEVEEEPEENQIVEIKEPEEPKQEELVEEVVSKPEPQPEPVPKVEPEPVAEQPAEEVKVPEVKEELSTEPEPAPEPVKQKEPEQPKEETTKQEPLELSLNDRFKQDEGSELGYKVGARTDKNLREMIDLSEKFVYANELFDGDTDYFERTLRYLNQCETFSEANTYINNEVKPKYEWAGKEEVEERFTNLVKMRFA